MKKNKQCKGKYYKLFKISNLWRKEYQGDFFSLDILSIGKVDSQYVLVLFNFSFILDI